IGKISMLSSAKPGIFLPVWLHMQTLKFQSQHASQQLQSKWSIDTLSISTPSHLTAKRLSSGDY
ncbi:MAG: hypothetical protein RR419_09300, partial [Akkermansia sp.]